VLPGAIWRAAGGARHAHTARRRARVRQLSHRCAARTMFCGVRAWAMVVSSSVIPKSRDGDNRALRRLVRVCCWEHARGIPSGDASPAARHPSPDALPQHRKARAVHTHATMSPDAGGLVWLVSPPRHACAAPMPSPHGDGMGAAPLTTASPTSSCHASRLCGTHAAFGRVCDAPATPILPAWR